MQILTDFFNFTLQCCDADAYLRLGQTCAETGECYDKLRPVGAILWFSIPYRLGLQPDDVLIGLRLLLAFISITLSVWAVLKVIRPHIPITYKNIYLIPFIAIGSIATHSIFLQPVLRTALSDTAASLFALIAIWLLVLNTSQSWLRFVALGLAGLCMGLAAWIRVFFLYPVLFTLLAWFVLWIFNKKQHLAGLVLFVALLPISIQFYSTWKHTGSFSYIDPQVTASLLKEHRDNKSIGYDMVLDSRGIWNWYSQCQDYQPLLPALEQGDFSSLYCLLSGRLNFYLGSYSANNFVNLGGYEVLWGRNLLRLWNDCNKDNQYVWTLKNLKRDENVVKAPDNTLSADRLIKPDPNSVGEIYQTITLRSRDVPFVFSTWVWGDQNTGTQQTTYVKMLIRNHLDGEIIAEKIIPLAADKQVQSLEATISKGAIYDFVVQSPPSSAAFYLWEDFDLRAPEPSKEGMESNIRTWSIFILVANSAAFIFSLCLIYKIRKDLHPFQILAGLFGTFIFGQAILSLPEQRFAIAPMIGAWIFCIAFVVLWFSGKISRRQQATQLPDLRRDYTGDGLRRKDLTENPIDQFTHWFKQAQQANLLDPNAMVVATVSSDGQPSARNVLLKGYDNSGFLFYTNLESRKAGQIAQNNKVALLFTWLPLNRQVKIEGVAEKLSTADALKYFLSRPKESQYAAWASNQSQKISSRQILEEKFFEMKEKFSKGEVPLPSFWGGYRVKPHKIEFWQGRENRLHDRFVYSLQSDGSWTIERLAP